MLLRQDALAVKTASFQINYTSTHTHTHDAEIQLLLHTLYIGPAKSVALHAAVIIVLTSLPIAKESHVIACGPHFIHIKST